MRHARFAFFWCFLLSFHNIVDGGMMMPLLNKDRFTRQNRYISSPILFYLFLAVEKGHGRTFRGTFMYVDMILVKV